MSNFHRYEQSVIRVCEVLHGHTVGTGDTLHPEAVDDLRKWLAWRISDDAWLPGARASALYDHAVRELAAACLLESRP